MEGGCVYYSRFLILEFVEIFQRCLDTIDAYQHRLLKNPLTLTLKYVY